MLILGYFPTWSIYRSNKDKTFKDVPFHLLSHLTIGFALPETDGSISTEAFDELNLPDIREYCGSTALKIGLTIGGWGRVEQFDSATNSEAQRHKLIESCIKLFNRYAQLDYLEIDWEYPTNAEQSSNLLAFLRGLRKSLPTGKSLNLCIPCDVRCDIFKLSEIKSVVDLFIVMGYDLCGDWSSYSGYHSALHPEISSNLLNLIAKSVPAEQVVLACPLYGRKFAKCTGIEEPFEKPNCDDECPEYSAIIKENRSTIQFDPVSVSYHCRHNGDFITFDGPQSIDYKCDWILKHKLGGMAFWNICGDGDGQDSLISIAHKRINKGN